MIRPTGASGPGRLPTFLSSSRRAIGRRSKRASSSGRHCSSASSPISTAREPRARTAPCRRRSSPAIRDFLRPLVGRHAPRRRAAPHLRRRPRPCSGRPLVGAGRPHAGSFRHGLRGGEPPGHLGGAVRALPRHACRAPRQLLPGAAGRPRGKVRARDGAYRPAHPRARPTRPTSSTPTSRAISASSWSREAI